MTDKHWHFKSGGRIDRSLRIRCQAVLGFRRRQPRRRTPRREEPNAIVQIGSGEHTIPNLKATQVELGAIRHLAFLGESGEFSPQSVGGFSERCLTRADLELAVRENLRSVEDVERYTATGMVVDQGKTSNMNALGILSELNQVPIPEVGTTTFRPPYDPVTLGTLAACHVGAFYHSLRRTPLDRWHEEYGAVFETLVAGGARPGTRMRARTGRGASE